MSAAVFAFCDGDERARSLAEDLGIAAHRIEHRAFPDGESLVRVPAAPAVAETALLFRSLNDPNAKIVEILFAAAALRASGARRVMLVAPYLGYMRQDIAFHPGEAISQRVIGRLIAEHFDGLVTVDPHLHRIAALDEIVSDIPAIAVSAAPALAAALARDIEPETILIGPDRESAPWVERIAAPLGLEMIVAEKCRSGDRDVALRLPEAARVGGRAAVIIDDIVSSGSTLIACAALLRAAGALRVEAAATHCLSGPADLDRLHAGGIARLRTSDSVLGPVATIPLATVLGDAIRELGWLDSTR